MKLEPQGRLRSLDILRGATIAGMILVNNAGDWGKTFSPLLHAEWHGWTPTDLVFPFFLFVLGVAIPLSFASRIESSGGVLGAVYKKIVRRTLMILGLGLVLNWFPFYDVTWSTARIPGVLQRIAIVYLIVSVAYLKLGKLGRIRLSAGLLLGYWAAMKLIPVPGFGPGDLGPTGNLAAWVDFNILGPHVWRYAPGPADPEGLLSTLPAVVTALAGIFTGEWLRSERSSSEKLIGLFVWGSIAAAAGCFFGYFFPINKNLWTSSYVVLTAGLAMVSLGVIYYFADIRKQDSWAKPFVVFGTNAITVYLLSGMLAKMLYKVRWLGADGSTITLKSWLYGRFFTTWIPDYYASFAWAVLHIVLMWAFVSLLYRKKIFIKI